MSEENNNANNPPPPPENIGTPPPPVGGEVPPAQGVTPPPVSGSVPPGGDVPPTKRPGYNGPPPDGEARTWGMLAHLAVLAGYIIPFGNILGPLVVWLMKKDQMPFVDDQGKESLNFQILVTIALIICVPLICIVIGAVLMIIIGLADLVLIILASIKANKGIAYRYPVNFRFVK